MNAYILVFILQFYSGSNAAISSATAEFNTKAACENAMREIRSESMTRQIPKFHVLTCLPKGQP